MLSTLCTWARASAAAAVAVGLAACGGGGGDLLTGTDPVASGDPPAARAHQLVQLQSLGGAWSWARDVNGRGDAVGASAASADPTAQAPMHAVRWTAGGLATDLGVLPGGVESFATGVDAKGNVVGLSQTSADLQDVSAVRWKPGGAIEELGATFFWSSVATNARGDVAWLAPAAGGGGELRVLAGSDTTVVPLPAADPTTLGPLLAIGGGGIVVLGRALWVPGAGWVTELPHVTAGATQGFGGVSGGGDVVGAETTGELTSLHGVLWSSRSTAVDLGAAVSPADINDRGVIVGQDFENFQTEGRPFMLAALGAPRELLPLPSEPGLALEAAGANAVSDSGDVVGSAVGFGPPQPDGADVRVSVALLWTTRASAGQVARVGRGLMPRAERGGAAFRPVDAAPSPLWCAQAPRHVARAAGCGSGGIGVR